MAAVMEQILPIIRSPFDNYSPERGDSLLVCGFDGWVSGPSFPIMEVQIS
jgi:hypothetical protein